MVMDPLGSNISLPVDTELGRVVALSYENVPGIAVKRASLRKPLAGGLILQSARFVAN